MKKVLLITSMMFGALVTNAQWTNQNAPLVYEGFMDAIKVVDANIAWGTTYSNATGTATKTRDFMRTVDGGTTWTKGLINSSPAALRPANIYPIDGNICYAAMYNPTAAGGKVYKTVNGGASWLQVGGNMFTQATAFADFVYFWDGQHGMAMGDPVGNPLKYEINLTNDSGVTWVAIPAANLPTLTDPAEYGIVNLYDAVDGHVWFATTYGDVYHSSDMGNTWTKSVTGIPANAVTGGRQDITAIAFTDTMHGLITQVAATGTTVMGTSDGGATWTTITPVGNCFGNDITGVPGSDIFVSAGSSQASGFGTSFSLDNGLTWSDWDAASHTCVDFADSLTGFSGEYITAASPGGAWKFAGSFALVSCGSSTINAGLGAMADSLVCFGDTVKFSVTGAVAPTDGTTHGFAVIVSSADLLGSNDPLNQAGVLGGTGVFGFPTNPFVTSLVNDGTIFPAGIYYFTPVVFGNATGTGNVTALVLDPACTTTGASVMVNVLANGDPLCPSSSIKEVTASQLTMSAYFNAAKNLDLTINSGISGKTEIAIFDLTGRCVYTSSINVVKGLNHQTLNVSNLNSGSYILKANTGTSQVTDKLIKL